MKLVRALAMFATGLILALRVGAELPVKSVLTLKAAKVTASAAETEANKRGSTVVIAVVDDSGHLLD